ncbi:MAG: hypothetical protein ACOC7V_00800 [Spirochaetota bacterium]
MLDLAKYEGNVDYAELVAEIKRLRGVASRFAEVSQMITADSEPLRPDTVRCEELCRRKAREALDAWKKL